MVQCFFTHQSFLYLVISSNKKHQLSLRQYSMSLLIHPFLPGNLPVINSTTTRTRLGIVHCTVLLFPPIFLIQYAAPVLQVYGQGYLASRVIQPFSNLSYLVNSISYLCVPDYRFQDGTALIHTSHASASVVLPGYGTKKIAVPCPTALSAIYFL